MGETEYNVRKSQSGHFSFKKFDYEEMKRTQMEPEGYRVKGLKNSLKTQVETLSQTCFSQSNMIDVQHPLHRLMAALLQKMSLSYGPISI